MALLRQLVQGVQEAAAHADEGVLRKPQLRGYGVSCFEANAPYVVCKLVRILLHNINAVRAVLLINLCGMSGAYVMPLQKEHDVFDFFLIRPRFLDSLYAHLADTQYANQVIWVFFDYVQCLSTKLLHDAFSKLWTNPFDQPGAEILLNAIHSRRQRFLKRLNGELPTILGVQFPCSRQRQY